MKGCQARRREGEQRSPVPPAAGLILSQVSAFAFQRGMPCSGSFSLLCDATVPVAGPTPALPPQGESGSESLSSPLGRGWRGVMAVSGQVRHRGVQLFPQCLLPSPILCLLPPGPLPSLAPSAEERALETPGTRGLRGPSSLGMGPLEVFPQKWENLD